MVSIKHQLIRAIFATSYILACGQYCNCDGSGATIFESKPVRTYFTDSSPQRYPYRKPWPLIDAFDYDICGRTDRDKWQQRVMGHRILGGQFVKRDEFPSFAQIHLTSLLKDTVHDQFCGGTLVHSNLVVTSAHCLFGAYRVQVTLGGHWGDERVGTTILADKWCIHYNHKNTSLIHPEYDLAMIRLREKVKYVQGQIEPACFSLGEQPGPNATCALVGMGMESETKKSGKLKSVLVKRCSRKNDMEPFAACYTANNGITCAGDSGSGVYCFDRTYVVPRVYVAGALSTTCDNSCKPGPIKQWAADFHWMTNPVRDLIEILTGTEGYTSYECHTY